MARRRSGLPWAPTSVPGIRDQWCTIIATLLDGLPARIDAARAAGNSAAADQWAAAAPAAAADLHALENAALIWIAREMVDLAVAAAESLPEWSPSAAIPATSGLVCLAKPAGHFRWPVPGSNTEVITMPVDALSWAARAGSVGVTVAFRWDRVGDRLAQILPRQPLVQHPVGVWDLNTPVAPRVEDGGASPLAFLGAAWLLMGQDRVTETRTITTESLPTTTGRAGDTVAPPTVTLVELRRIASQEASESEAGAGRRYSRRFFVTGHWRQQAVGPNRSLRKPIWISPYVKGPDNAPLVPTTRVTVWRH
jgi:hypothetical protein